MSVHAHVHTAMIAVASTQTVRGAIAETARVATFTAAARHRPTEVARPRVPTESVGRSGAERPTKRFSHRLILWKYVFFGIRFASSGHYPSQTYLLKFVSQLYDRYRNGKGPTFYRDALVIYGSSAVSACMYPYVFLTLRRSSEYETESGWAGGRAILCFFVRWELGRKLGRSVGRRPTDRPSSRASYRQAAAVKVAAALGRNTPV